MQLQYMDIIGTAEGTRDFLSSMHICNYFFILNTNSDIYIINTLLVRLFFEKTSHSAATLRKYDQFTSTTIASLKSK